MPAAVGETLLTTLFADCHYYFSDPASKPPHHRFDRASYLYLFYNASSRQAKLEVANHAGTADQDAFHGYLNVANVAYSYLQPTLVTLYINPGAIQDQSTWHLPSLDARNECKHSYQLHAMDIYLWTEKDATTFLAHLKSVLASDQFDIKNTPPPVGQESLGGVGTPHSEHRDSMSPVVQLLEKTAVGTHFPPRAASATPATSAAASPNPPPAPMAYNPAAPAAPEPVQYREKTPPPIDENGTGLAAAAKYDSVPQQTPYGSSPGTAYHNSSTHPHTPLQCNYFSGPPRQHRQSSFSSFPGPPQSAAERNSPQSYPSGNSIPPPPPPSQQQRAPSFGPLSQSTLPTQSPPPGQQSFSRQSMNPGQHTTYTPGPPSTSTNPTSPGFAPAYNTPLQSPAFPGPPPQQQQVPPVGGYSTYSYSSSSSQAAAGGGDFTPMGAYQGDLHNQIYRPTEAEATPKPTHQQQQQQAKPEGKFSVGKVEGNVNKYLKKLDKLW